MMGGGGRDPADKECRERSRQLGASAFDFMVWSKRACTVLTIAMTIAIRVAIGNSRNVVREKRRHWGANWHENHNATSPQPRPNTTSSQYHK